MVNGARWTVTLQDQHRCTLGTNDLLDVKCKRLTDSTQLGYVFRDGMESRWKPWEASYVSNHQCIPTAKPP
jgi:hypothetical protein